jgi:lipopolysaccharide/colanic/teichoic acid biosynthesis glycosyltransferase
MDLMIASAAVIAAAPAFAILGLLIRRDAGPVIFRQTRVGQEGQPFEMLKFRSMRVGAEHPDQRWCVAADERVTRVGRFMRRTHLDELPQLLNVLRGEMSIVGPRPEQPGFVTRLEQAIPFYSRRLLARPGITGWAQIRCGYSGSDAGSAFKVCHDLYYLKHRSVALDLMILGETLRTLVADSSQWDQQAEQRMFAVGASEQANALLARVRPTQSGAP